MLSVLFAALLLISGVYGIISLVVSPENIASGVLSVVFTLSFCVGFAGCGLMLYKDTTRRPVIIALIVLYCAVIVMFSISLASTVRLGGNIAMNLINISLCVLATGLLITGLCLRDE